MTDLALDNQIVDSRRQKEPTELYPMLRNNPVLRIYHDFGPPSIAYLVESGPLISALSWRRTVLRLRCWQWPPHQNFWRIFIVLQLCCFTLIRKNKIKVVSKLSQISPLDCSQSLYCNSHKNKTLKYANLRVIKRHGRSGHPRVPSEQPAQIQTKIGPPTTWMGMRHRLDSSNCNIRFAFV